MYFPNNGVEDNLVDNEWKSELNLCYNFKSSDNIATRTPKHHHDDTLFQNLSDTKTIKNLTGFHFIKAIFIYNKDINMVSLYI